MANDKVVSLGQSISHDKLQSVQSVIIGSCIQLTCMRGRAIDKSGQDSRAHKRPSILARRQLQTAGESLIFENVWKRKMTGTAAVLFSVNISEEQIGNSAM